MGKQDPMDHEAPAAPEDIDTPDYWDANEYQALGEMLRATWISALYDPELYAERQEWRARYDALHARFGKKEDASAPVIPPAP